MPDIRSAAAASPALASAPAAAPSPGVPQPAVVALIGIPGSGKAAVAQALAADQSMRRLDRDAIRQAMFPECTFSFAETRAAFRALLLALEINCLIGASSVIEGMTFSRRRDLARVDAAIRHFGFLPIPIFLDCSLQTARSRIAERIAAQPALAATCGPDLAADVRARFDAPPPNALVVNANLPLDEVARVVVDAVARLRAA